MAKLSLNLDSLASLRETRKGRNPDPVAAAVLAELAGVHGISVHLREDRKHIQERDVKLLRQTLSTKLILELSPSEQNIQFAIDVLPDMVLLVPEISEGMDSNAGLNFETQFEMAAKAVSSLRMHDIYVGALIEPVITHMKAAKRMGLQSIHLHCGAYATAYDYGEEQQSWEVELDRLDKAAQIARKSDFAVTAGRGLNFQNLEPLLGVREIEEFYIGHALVAKAALVGVDRAVRDMVALLGGADS